MQHNYIYKKKREQKILDNSLISVSVPSPPRSLPCWHPSRYSVLPMFLIVSKRSLAWCYIQLGRTVYITVYLKYIFKM